MPHPENQGEHHEIGAGKAGPFMGRKLRDDLTPQQLFNLEEHGSIHFESAGAKRKP